MKTRKTFFIISMVLCFMIPMKTMTQEPDTALYAELSNADSLIISELYIGGRGYGYVEFTNIGNKPLNMKNYASGRGHQGYIMNQPGYGAIRKGDKMYFPDHVLPPDSSYVAAYIRDYADKRPELDLPRTNRDIWKHADFEVHWDEAENGDNNGMDSINQDGRVAIAWRNWSAQWLEWNNGEDSVVIDGTRVPYDPQTGIYSYSKGRDRSVNAIAGIPEAYSNYVMVRKTTQQFGNMNWNESRGTNPDNSEWILIPEMDETAGVFNPFFTTLGNHDAADLTDDYVKSDLIDIDWDNSKMSVPWGIYADSIMQEFNLSNGIGWDLHYSPVPEDSIYNIIVTGDSLTLYAVGEAVETMTFGLEQKEAPEDMNEVFPLNRKVRNDAGNYVWTTPYRVTEGVPEMDSVADIAYGTRVDTLLKYISKAEEANWEIEWTDGIERPDVKWGDILKVTAKNGDEKNYFLAVDSIPAPNRNPLLGAITWPDAPAPVLNNPAWQGDTIPDFDPERTAYNLDVPYGISNVPVLDAITEDLNASVNIDMAKTLTGKAEDRTTTITVIADDDSTKKEYTIVFQQDKPIDIEQPFTPDPVITRILHRDFNIRFMIQITNPGNRTIDLRNYAFVRASPGNTPIDHITDSAYGPRYQVYVPGYDYQTLEEWTTKPGILVEDNEVNPILEPGESFVAEVTANNNHETMIEHRRRAADIVFTNRPWIYDEWNEDRAFWGTENAKIVHDPNAFGGHGNNPHFMNWRTYQSATALYKITSDSVKDGTKGRFDPDDFEMVDLWGVYTSDRWHPTGDTVTDPAVNNFTRKTQYWQGDTLPGYPGSWGETPEESEWIRKDAEWLDKNDLSNAALGDGIGQHTFDPIEVYISTISSNEYKVSDGYKDFQSVKGITTGTTVSEFIEKLVTLEGQSLEVLHRNESDEVLNEDTLKVISADNNNTTHYLLSVSEEGLSSDAEIVSSVYDVEIDGKNGTLSGIQIEATLEKVIDNVTVPQFATLNVIDSDGNPVPLQMRNFNQGYTKTYANNDMLFEVVAENGVDTITYELLLDVPVTTAYIFSNVFDVDQETNVISLIPNGIWVASFLDHLMSNKGSVIKVFNKAGIEREQGNVAFDDIVVVTSPDGEHTKTYFLNFLEEQEGNEAWIRSNVYAVNQFENIISGIEPETQVSIVQNLLIPAPQASMGIVDEKGNEKTAGNVVEGDKAEVTSGNGKYTKQYELNIQGTEAFVNSDLYQVNQDLGLISEVPSQTQISELLNNLIPATDASMMVVDENGDEVPSGNIDTAKYQVKVVSGNMQNEMHYDIQFIPEGTEAFVTALDEAITINQSAGIISGIPKETPVSELMTMLLPAEGATVTVIDENDQEVPDGDNVTKEMRLKVVSENGQNEKYYNLSLAVSISNDVDRPEITVYPNPANDVVFIKGAAVNSKIVVRNILGETMKIRQVVNDNRTSIQLDALSNGIYFITVITENQLAETVKIIKE